MAKNKRFEPAILRALEKQKSRRQAENTGPAFNDEAVQRLTLTEPTGSCRYSDSFGEPQCESPVTKGYCDSKGGFFAEEGRC